VRNAAVARGRREARQKQKVRIRWSCTSTWGNVRENADKFPAHKRAHLMVQSQIKASGALSSDPTIEIKVKSDLTGKR
jgi:hypothetical protein